MKKIIPIFLFIVICINHLYIIDAVMHFSGKYTTDNTQIAENLTLDEESDSENDNKTKEKEKGEENEKYFFRNYLNANLKYSTYNKHQFIWFITVLNKYPYKADSLRPPTHA